MRLITNSMETDRLKMHLLEAAENAKVSIASAFFSDWETLEKIVRQNCPVALIVRLGAGTSVEALEKALDLENVNIRFFNDQHFHPKFYIFGQHIAYLGSANFTRFGLMRNQEVVVEIEDEEIISNLQCVFETYWEGAKPLTAKELELYKKIMKGRLSVESTDFSFAKELEKAMGTFAFDNVELDKKKTGIVDRSIVKFQKEYQDFLSSYSQLSEIYASFRQRRWHSIPLRIELDRFVWWVGETYGADEKYKPETGLSQTEIASRIQSFIPEFLVSDNKWLDHDAIPRYHQIADAFSSSEKLDSLSDEEIADVLGDCVFSFNSNRFYKDGVENHKRLFVAKNPKGRIKRTFKYLLFGHDEYPIRLARCIHDPNYKLKTIGKNGITELFGLANHEEIPIRNQRITKTLPWLGL